MRWFKAPSTLAVVCCVVLFHLPPLAAASANPEEEGPLSGQQYSGHLSERHLEVRGLIESRRQEVFDNPRSDRVVRAPGRSGSSRSGSSETRTAPVDPRSIHASSNPCITSETEADFDCVRVVNDTCSDTVEAPEPLQAAGGSTMAGGSSRAAPRTQNRWPQQSLKPQRPSILRCSSTPKSSRSSRA